jgi:hypothetical protein
MNARWPALPGLVAAAWLLGGGCSTEPPAGALVLTQTPPFAGTNRAATLLDARYPAGSRVVLLLPPYRTHDVRLLSKGLLAAGDPVVAPDGRTVFFAGRRDAASDWQIYQARLTGGAPRRVTAMPGGALNPAVMAGGDVVFASPVPPADQPWTAARPAALYAQKPGAAPRRLTFTPHSALEPTVLADGRILFVTVQPGAAGPDGPRLGLFTVNNDGTELTAFAGQHDGGWPVLRRPRELDRARVAFLAAEQHTAAELTRAEAVRLARPQRSRAPLLPGVNGACRAVEPGEPGEWLACLEPRGLAGRGHPDTFGVYRVRADAAETVTLLFDDPAWHEVEALRLAPRPWPQGHISAMTPERASGTVLCLDVNETSYTSGPATNRAARVRLAQWTDAGEQVLGELKPHADGSFMVELPADVPLVIEALDAAGAVVRRCPPLVWVRSGENRACVGCHEPHNYAPRNVRPLAANLPPATLQPPGPALAGKQP